MKIRLMRAELFHADGRTDRHDEAISRFSQFCQRAEEWIYISKTRSLGLGSFGSG
jgi:uncharacterized protein YchJ